MRTLIDLTGKKFGRLTVVGYSHKDSHGACYWECVCKCGSPLIVRGQNLRSGHTQSCGCLQKERVAVANMTHGLKGTRLYRIWIDMKGRCYNPKATCHKDYGGRGITVCDEWKDNFQAFYDWAMPNGYRDDLSIDRIDVNGNYEPSNCRWATASEQQKNKRKNKEK